MTAVLQLRRSFSKQPPVVRPQRFSRTTGPTAATGSKFQSEYPRIMAEAALKAVRAAIDETVMLLTLSLHHYWHTY